MPVTTQQFSYNQDYWHAVLAVGGEVGGGGWVRGGAGVGRVWAARGQGRREGVMKTFAPELHQFKRGGSPRGQPRRWILRNRSVLPHQR